jgi:hypothetical protein
MAVLSIQDLLVKFGSGKSPRSADYVDLIDSLADDRNAVYFSATAPTDTEANPLWFNTSTNVLSVYDGEWIAAGGAAGPTGATGATGSSGVAFSTPHISGRYYRTIGNNTPGARAFAANVTRYSPILIPTSTTYDRIGIAAGSTFSGTASVRLGIYNDLNGQPDTVLLDAGTIAPTASGQEYQITINQTLSAGFYWLAFNTITAATTNTYVGFDGSIATSTPAVNYLNLSFASATGMGVGFTESVNATSGFATASSPTTVGTVPLVGIRAS